MIALLDTHKDMLAELCRRYSVARLEIFGSAATGSFNYETSDLDFIVTFGSHPSLLLSEQYFGFKHALEELLGHSVDLLEEQAIENPYFLHAIQPERVLLYAA